MTHFRILHLAASLVLVCAAGVVQAQGVLSSAPRMTGDPAKTRAYEQSAFGRPVQPPALPGARADRSAAAPATNVPSALSPNDALFDAVNRGDVPAARDALARGAEVDAHNMLGLSALDLAVDLGRNDLTFLLLSLRGANQGPRQANAAATTKRVAAASPVAPRAAKPAGTVAARAVAAQPVRVAARSANDPGTPVPSAGFLGFGGAYTQ